ncbi:T9SS type A sorting domain-containing protein [Oceanihabitans sp. 2_MG-2023]|uniref:T9SS type A sorting domain-containing protein n=1 Tax=Oceanihabitans sp. 2_MG-2023 TaxID=3062661 RepID=UPI0026E16F5D|nr:T9SS type A sorting domain-containing protein [Oceanihabitans sp. 2_MG-2023]MDO6597510.1 T9SS type A sorting domain-containing protein [Oceanihabitans sp. 2_MG-2023]
MKYSLSILLLTISSITFAQSDLFVSNGSYVYVDGTAFTSGPNVAPLYVTDDVNLDTNGHVYLRNDAQLLQSNATLASTNTGTGQLSVYQTGNSNTYMYNYWASPVGQNSGVTGNSALMPSNNMYRETGAPITSTPYGFVAGYDGTTTQIASYWLYTFIGLPSTTNAYEDWIGLGGGSLPVGGDPNGTLASGYGFSMKGNATGAMQYDFRGRPNNGDITVTLHPNRETLVGNPYPSAIDALEFIHDTNTQANTTGVLKYWEQAPGATSHVLSNYVGGYALYTISAGGVDSFTPAVFRMYLLNGNVAGGPSPGTGSKTGRRYIPIGQGFMMEGTASATNISFSNSHRVFYKQSSPNSEFFRTSNSSSDTNSETLPQSRYNEDGNNIVPADFKRFRINVGFDNNGNDSYTRQLLLNFHATATDGFDYGLEAQIAEQVSSDANWVLDGTPYAIQAFNYDQTLKIPLIVNINNQQLVRFGIYDVQNFNEEQPIYIHDKINDSYINLQDQAYEITLETGNYTDRFEIVFQSQSLSTEEFNEEDFLVMQNNNTAQLIVLNPKQLEVQSISLFDVSGKRIFNEVNLSTQDSYQFSTQGLSDGVYITKVTFTNQSTSSKKVVISQKN